jgi:hypothetical protein
VTAIIALIGALVAMACAIFDKRPSKVTYIHLPSTPPDIHSSAWKQAIADTVAELNSTRTR